MLEEFSQVLSLDDTTTTLVVLGQACAHHIGVLLLKVAQTLVAQILLIRNHVGPVLHTYHRVERIGVIAYGVQTTNNTTHRCTSNNVNGNTRLLQYLQHSDMGHAFCTTTTQHDTHLGSWPSLSCNFF